MPRPRSSRRSSSYTIPMSGPRTAHHEAGYAVIGRVLGLVGGKVTRVREILPRAQHRRTGDVPHRHGHHRGQNHHHDGGV